MAQRDRQARLCLPGPEIGPFARPVQLAATSDCATAPPGVAPAPVTMKKSSARSRAATVMARVTSQDLDPDGTEDVWLAGGERQDVLAFRPAARRAFRDLDHVGQFDPARPAGAKKRGHQTRPRL